MLTHTHIVLQEPRTSFRRKYSVLHRLNSLHHWTPTSFPKCLCCWCYLFIVSSRFKTLRSQNKCEHLSKNKSTQVYLKKLTRRNNNGLLTNKTKPEEKPQKLLPCQQTILITHSQYYSYKSRRCQSGVSMLFTHLKDVIRNRKPDGLHFCLYTQYRKKTVKHPYWPLQKSKSPLRIWTQISGVEERHILNIHFSSIQSVLVKMQDIILAVWGIVFLAKLGKYLNVNWYEVLSLTIPLKWKGTLRATWDIVVTCD